MRLRTIGALCATCATAVPPVVAIAAEPTAAVAPAPTPVPDAQAHAHERHPHRHKRHAQRHKRHVRLHARHVSGPLASIASCESGGNPRAISASGTYRGKYQFSRQTWASVGGSGDPARAPESEQDRRAAILYRTQGAGQWPVCGR